MRNPPGASGGARPFRVVRAHAGAQAPALCALLVFTGLVAACGSAPATSVGTGPPVPAITAPASYSGHGSIGQAYVLGAKAGTKLLLTDASGHEVVSGVADRLGSLIVRNIPPGDGYTFRDVDGSSVHGTSPFRVLAPTDTPPQSFYGSQHMHAGLNYLTMRDGVKLAATLRLPSGKTLADGPFPTVIEYSGYAIAAPHDLLPALVSGKSDPLAPDTATAVGALVAPLLGFATVSLQMRGSGCSGGAFGLFDLPTIYDGYDAVEIVAAQSFVKGHKVGMVGISFSGFSQLFVAGTDPPHLAAITPLSVTDDFYSTGFPGGIFNNGFALDWMNQRVSDAQPAPQGGQEYARVLVKDGDRTCLANQALRLQTQSITQVVGSSTQRVPSVYDVRTAADWAKKITVPVYLAGAFQDDETGGQWSNLVPNLAGDPNVWVTLVNGTHIDSLGNAILTRWVEFLDLFVAGELPTTSQAGLVSVLETGISDQMAGNHTSGAPVPVRFTDARSVAAAKSGFERDARVRVLFDNGGSASAPGAMQSEWEEDFSSWPPHRARATTMYLGAGGALAETAPGARTTVSFRPDPDARPRTSLPANGNAWAARPHYDWAPVTGGEGVGFISAPLAHDVVMAGPASLDLQLESSASDTDLQVEITEVLPDGSEMYVQSGFLRASDRTLDASASTALHPVPTFARGVPLPRGRFVEVRIPIMPFAFAFRAGSRIRVVVSAPGGDRPSWAFDTFATHGKVTDTLALGGVHASALVAPVIPGLAAPDAPPACPSLRGEPCRSYVAAGNGG